MVQIACDLHDAIEAKVQAEQVQRCIDYLQATWRWKLLLKLLCRADRIRACLVRAAWMLLLPNIRLLSLILWGVWAAGSRCGTFVLRSWIFTGAILVIIPLCTAHNSRSTALAQGSLGMQL